MNVLITGGAGFIGSHLAERCLEAGWKVSVLDDLSSGSFDNIAPLQSCSHFSFAFTSVLNASRVAEMMDEADLVFHLAATVGMRLVLERPVQTIETNVQGTEVVLRAAAKTKKRVLIASSSEVYGKSTAWPFREDSDFSMGPPSRTRWGYACSKALDEFLGFAYWNEHGVPITVLRFFNTVGPRQTGRYGMVLPTFVRQALLEEPLTVFGSGKQRRCFTYVGDVVEVLVRIAISHDTVGEVLNIGTDQEITMLDLAGLVKKITNSRSEIVQVPYEEAYGPGYEDVLRRVPCLKKIERLIGFRPSTPIEETIRYVAADISEGLTELSHLRSDEQYEPRSSNEEDVMAGVSCTSREW